MELSTRRLRYFLDTEELIRNHGADLILGIIIIIFLLLCFFSPKKITILVLFSICLNAKFYIDWN